MRRSPCFRPAGPLLALLAGLAIPGPTRAQELPDIEVRLELLQDYVYEGDPVHARVTVRNNGPDNVPNPVKLPLLEGVRVAALGSRPLRPSDEGKPAEPERPDRLSGGEFYGAVVDLSELYPELHTVGTFSILWSADGLSSERRSVRILPRFDPSKYYRADIATNAGSFSLELLSEEAPIAVKAFIDMANMGFYDGLEIHEVRPDLLVAAGNPAVGDRRARDPFSYPAETTATPLLIGTVVMKPTGAAPPANGSEFIVLLEPQPSWLGQVTAFAVVSDGIEVVQAMSRRQSSGSTQPPFFRPTPEITIRNVQVTEITPPPGVSSAMRPPAGETGRIR